MNSTPESPQKRPSMTDDITVRDIILWNRIGRISVLLAKRLNIEPERASTSSMKVIPANTCMMKLPVYI